MRANLNNLSKREFSFLASGIHWSQLFEKVTPDAPYTLAQVMGVLIADAGIFAIVAWYVEAINPCGDGVPQKPYFFILV